MGAQWKNQHKSEGANAKGKMIHKLAREIQVAAKMGVPDPESNPRLRAAIEAAKKQSVTRDTIERAIKKGSGADKDAANFELVTYEGFAPHQVAVILEIMTDNKNRSSHEVKQLFKKGQMGAPGSVGWMFNHTGIIEAAHHDLTLDLESVAIEVGAQNVEALDASEIEANTIGARFIADVADLDSANKALQAAGWKVTKAELGYVPKNLVELSPEAEKEVIEFLQEMDDYDDTHRVYVALK
jgi:YebC/PmpR family DNA-binding regulatory protein